MLTTDHARSLFLVQFCFHSFTDLFVCSFMHSFIRSFIHACMHSINKYISSPKKPITHTRCYRTYEDPKGPFCLCRSFCELPARGSSRLTQSADLITPGKEMPHRRMVTFHFISVVNVVAGFPVKWGCQFPSQRPRVQVT